MAADADSGNPVGIMAGKAGDLSCPGVGIMFVGPPIPEPGRGTDNIGVRMASETEEVAARIVPSRKGGVGGGSESGDGHVVPVHKNMLVLRSVGAIGSRAPRLHTLVAVMAVGAVYLPHVRLHVAGGEAGAAAGTERRNRMEGGGSRPVEPVDHVRVIYHPVRVVDPLECAGIAPRV